VMGSFVFSHSALILTMLSEPFICVSFARNKHFAGADQLRKMFVLNERNTDGGLVGPNLIRIGVDHRNVFQGGHTLPRKHIAKGIGNDCVWESMFVHTSKGNG
jgi:hypothetical protein